jgi:HAD superfamily 5'-nucleotidase-like hydrolase
MASPLLFIASLSFIGPARVGRALRRGGASPLASFAVPPDDARPPALFDDCLAEYSSLSPAWAEDAKLMDSMREDEEELMLMMDKVGIAATRPDELPQRGVYCTRALDMRSIKAIGYDMDYTLIDYKMELFEERVYHYSKESLLKKGFPVEGLSFNHERVVRGLVIDTQLGHLLKVDRFGFVRRAMHGKRMLSKAEIDEDYGGSLPVDLREARWVFLNTLFSVSEGCLYAQLVERLDSGQLLEESKPPFDAAKCSTYEQLYRAVSKALFKAHVQGRMKAEVMSEPLRFINVDPAYCRTLLDQRASGKKLALITNSDWVYTSTMMQATYEPFLPSTMRWMDLFDVIVVSACKPEFFSDARRPVYEIATSEGYLREGFEFREGKNNAFAGGHARLLERCFSLSGSQVLYVGDHLFSDVNLAKRGLAWRTCLVLQELEEEMRGLAAGQQDAQKLTRLLRKKDLQAAYANHLRLRLVHTGSAAHDNATRDPAADAHGDPSAAAARLAASSSSGLEVGDTSERERLERVLEQLEQQLAVSEAEIETAIAQEGSHVNQFWGYMSRAGFADKSHLMRQIEKYADIYTSRVSNLLPYTPYKQFLCQRQSLAHSTSSTLGRPLMEHWQVFEEQDAGLFLPETQQS